MGLRVPKQMIATTAVVLALLPLLAGGSLWAIAGRPGHAYTLTFRIWQTSRIDLIISKCTARHPGRLLLLQTEINRRNRLTDSVTRVLVGGRVAPPCP